MSAHRPIASCEQVTDFLFCVMILFAFSIASITQVVLGQDTETRASSEAKESANESAVEKEVQAAFGKRIDFNFEETTLNEVANDLGKTSGVDIKLDLRALDDVGYDGKAKVSFRARGISVRAGLHHLLRQLELTWRIRDRTIEITTPEAAELNLDTRFYDVSDLASPYDDAAFLKTDLLIDTITSTVDPSNWDCVGGYGAATAFRGLLVISCTRAAHEEIARLLASFRQLARAYAEDPANTVIEPITLCSTAADRAVRDAVDDKTICVNLENVTLDEAVDTISKLSDVPIVIDRSALEDEGWYDPFGAPAKPTASAAAADPFGAPAKAACPRTPVHREPMVSCVMKDATLRAALDSVLQPLELAWMVRDEAILITTSEERECYLPIRLYPIGDLVVDDDGLWSPEAYDALMDVITGIHPDTWDQVGGPGSIEPLEGIPSLVVSQTDEIHHQVARILTRLRHALSNQEANPHAKNRADRQEENRMVLRIYYVTSPWDYRLPAQVGIDDLVTLTRDLVAPETWSKEARGTIHKLRSAIVIRNRPEVHREFTKLLARLGFQWHSTFEGRLRHTPKNIPVVGENQNGQNPMGMGGMFAVQDR